MSNRLGEDLFRVWLQQSVLGKINGCANPVFIAQLRFHDERLARKN